MALPTVVDSLEIVPESVRSHYKQVDDKYVLDADIESHPQVQGLRGAYRSDHEKVGQLKQQLESLKDVDPIRWNKLKGLSDEDLALLESARNSGNDSGTKLNGGHGSLDLESELEKRLLPVKTAHKAELERQAAALAAAREERNQMEHQMKRIQVQTALTAACAEVGVLPSAVEDVVYLGQRYFKVSDTGEVVATDTSGVELFGTDGKPMRAREWIISRANEKAHWFPFNSGGGANGSRFNGEGRASKRSELKTPESKVAFIKKYGREAFENLSD